MMRRCLVAACGLAGACACASAQTNARLEFEFDRLVVSPSNPEVRLTVYAAWDQADPPRGVRSFVLGFVNYDLQATSGEFTSAALILGMNPPNNPGVINGSRIDGAGIGQVHITGGISILGSPDNPIALAEYTWTTSDFTPRRVDFESEHTSHFSVVPWPGGVSIQMWPHQFTPGFGSIRVVPGPAVAGPLVCCSAVWIWRRRRQ